MLPKIKRHIRVQNLSFIAALSTANLMHTTRHLWTTVMLRAVKKKCTVVSVDYSMLCLKSGQVYSPEKYGIMVIKGRQHWLGA
jgi:hypothetical protein